MNTPDRFDKLAREALHFAREAKRHQRSARVALIVSFVAMLVTISAALWRFYK